jgi:AraC-like DNA-binding protein
MKKMNSSKTIYPSPLLSQYVKYYWILNADGTYPIQTIPSGCIHLVFHRGSGLYFSNGELQPKNFIRGQLSSYGELSPCGHIDMIAVVFQPLGLVPFVSFGLNEIYNQYIDLESLEDIDLKNLGRDISNEEDILICIKHIEKFLINKVCNFKKYNYDRLFNSIQLIKENIEINVPVLANRACLGYRHFKREFYKYVGIAPKEYLRIVRFQKILYILQRKPDIDMGELAYMCGFYDNSHLVKDFRSMSGCSPTEYLISRNPHSTFFSDNSRLNLIRAQ